MSANFELFSVFNRVMVGLPSVENREMILKTLLSKEKVENLDFKELATMTEGYSGSDLKVSFWVDNIITLNCNQYDELMKLTTGKQNLCVTAAYRPVRELIQQERQKDMVTTYLLRSSSALAIFLFFQILIYSNA